MTHLNCIMGFIYSSSILTQAKDQLATLTNHLQEMAKGNATRENIWCTLFITKGFQRNELLMIQNYNRPLNFYNCREVGNIA
jgi:hypothetical protein